MKRGRMPPASRLTIVLQSLCAAVALTGLTEMALAPAPVAWAQDDRPADSAPPAEETPKRNGAVAAIGRAHEMISSRITETADRLDTFLGKPRVLEESNRSYLKVALLRISDEDGMDVAREFKVKIVLPRLQDRIHLIITQENDEEEISPEAGTAFARDLTTGTPSRDLTSALRLMLRSARDLNIYIDAGVRVRVHPTVFSRIRYRRSAELGRWALRFTQSVKWEEQFQEHPSQWETISRLDFDRPIPPKFFFRASLQGAWYEGRHGYFVTQGFSLVHQVSERRALVYEWNTLARTGQLVRTKNNTDIIMDPDGRFRIEETGFKIQYRQTVGWPWFFFEADAERAFRRDLGPDLDLDSFWRSLVKIEAQFRDLRETGVRRDARPGERLWALL